MRAIDRGVPPIRPDAVRHKVKRPLRRTPAATAASSARTRFGGGLHKKGAMLWCCVCVVALLLEPLAHPRNPRSPNNSALAG